MSKEVKSLQYKGVYWRELLDGDRQYFLRVIRAGKLRRIAIGRASDGCTEAFCAEKYRAYCESEKFLKEVVDPQNFVVAHDLTFRQLLDYYCKNRQLKASTYKQLLLLYQVPFIDEKRLTHSRLQTYADKLLKTRAVTTVRLRIKQIRAVIRFAIAREIYRFPDPTLGIVLPKTLSVRQRYLNSQEIKKLLEAVKYDWRLYLFVKMSLCTGARLGTILSVHRQDIEEDGTVNLFNHKSQRWYKGFLDEETMELVRKREGYIFAKNEFETEPPTNSTIQNSLKPILDRLFNKNNTPKELRAVVHTLRHSVATQQIRHGVPLEVVSKTLDHSSIAVTSLYYAKVPNELVRKAVTNLWND